METNCNGTQPEVTPGAAFRAMREQGVVQTLPSGRVVRMRTVTPDRLLRLGHIPDILTPFALGLLYGKDPDVEAVQFLQPREQAQEAIAMLDSIAVVCRAALVSPRVVDDPQAEDEIAIEDLTIDERGWVFRLALWPAEMLKSFRFQPSGNVETLPDGQEPEPTPEPAGGGA